MLSFYSNWIYLIILLYSPQQKVNQNNDKYINNDYKIDNNLIEISRNLCQTDPNSCDNRVNHFVISSLQLLLDKLQLISNKSSENVIQMRASISSRNLNILRQYLPKDYSCLNCEQLEEFEDTIKEFIDKIELIDDKYNRNSYQNIIGLCFNSFKILLYFTTFLISIFITNYLFKNFEIVFKAKNLLKFRTIVILIMVISLLIALVWKWRQLYLIELSRKQSLVINTPKECLNRCEKTTFSSWLRHYLYSYESKRHDYYRAVTVDPFWEVNPLIAISELLSELIFTPLKSFGNFLGNNSLIIYQILLLIDFLFFFISFLFVSKFFSHIPFYLVIPVFILTSFCAFLLMMLLAFWLLMPNKYSIKIPFFMTIQFERNNKELTSNNHNNSIQSDNQFVKRYQIKANIVNVYHNNDHNVKRDQITFDENDYFETNNLSIPFSELD